MSVSSVSVSDFLSNHGDQLVNGAEIVGRSIDRQKVLEAVYKGKKQIKSIDFISQQTGLNKVRVLQEGAKMCPMLIEKVPNGYKKKTEFATRYKKILALAKDKNKRNRIATRAKLGSGKGVAVTIVSARPLKQPKRITVDDVSSFSKVSAQGSVSPRPIKEEKIKQGIAKIIGEKYTAKDWGGEKSDLYSTRIKLKSTRLPLAIAFKGKGTKGKLVPKKMGKNGDQINRLFTEPAQIFLVVYCGEIDSSIISQMQAFAVAEAMKGKNIYYGVIDGSDLARLMAAYPECF